MRILVLASGAIHAAPDLALALNPDGRPKVAPGGEVVKCSAAHLKYLPEIDLSLV